MKILGEINMSAVKSGLYLINNTDLMWYWNLAEKRFERPAKRPSGSIIKPVVFSDCTYIRDEEQFTITKLEEVSNGKRIYPTKAVFIK